MRPAEFRDPESKRSYLIYNDSAGTQLEASIRSLLQAEHYPFRVTRRAGELENLLRKTRYTHLILLLGESASTGLERALSHVRNLANVRDLQLMAVLRNNNDFEVQRALMLGVRHIYVTPMDLRWLLEPGPAARDFPHFEIGPVPCSVDTFGRVGKIIKEPLGNLQVEMDIALKDGEKIELTSLLAKDLEIPTLSTEVLKSHGVDHYYQYTHAYHLKWNSNVDLRAKLQSWASDHRIDFTIPKTKILFVTERLQWDWERALPKGVFSVYSETPQRLTPTYLEHLNPRIVVYEHKTPELMAILESWERAHPEPRKIIEKWPEKNVRSFITGVRATLRARVAEAVGSAFYLTRRSPYSRFAIRMDGEIISVAHSHIRVRLPHVVSPGTIVRILCPFLDDPRRSVIFGRVLETHQKVAECCVIPETEVPNRTLEELRLLFEGGSNQKLDTLARHPRPLEGPDLFFMEAVDEASGFVAWIKRWIRYLTGN